MAIVTVEKPKRTLRDDPDITQFLGSKGMVFQRWALPAAIETLRRNPSLSDAEKADVLKAYKPRLDGEAKDRGYIQADIIVLSPATPNLDGLLAKFDKTHLHDDDEVRYIFDGEGVFGFEPKDGAPFTVTVAAGDYIVVPAKTWHWFTLTAGRSIKAIRLFKDTSGWVPHYKSAMG